MEVEASSAGGVALGVTIDSGARRPPRRRRGTAMDAETETVSVLSSLVGISPKPAPDLLGPAPLDVGALGPADDGPAPGGDVPPKTALSDGWPV